MRRTLGSIKIAKDSNFRKVLCIVKNWNRIWMHFCDISDDISYTVYLMHCARPEGPSFLVHLRGMHGTWLHGLLQI